MVQCDKLLSFLDLLPFLSTSPTIGDKNGIGKYFRWASFCDSNMPKYPKSTEKKRHYCSLCSNYRGKDVDGRTVVLHKFPADLNLQKTWIRRVKTVMPSFNLNKNSRLCSEHFVDGKYSDQHNVPSVFDLKTKKKLFGTSKVSFCSFIHYLICAASSVFIVGYPTTILPCHHNE